MASSAGTEEHAPRATIPLPGVVENAGSEVFEGERMRLTPRRPAHLGAM